MEYVVGEVNRDSNGDIDTDYYRQAAIDVIRREADTNGIDTARMTSNQFNSLLKAAYRSLFRPEGRTQGRQGSKAGKAGYTEREAVTLAELYTELCGIYNARPSAYGFSCLTGIDDGKTLDNLTAAKSNITKATKNAVLNGLFDTPLGKTVLANNDPETGLMFARQNMITAHEVKHCDDINELENMRRSRHGIEQKET